MTSLIQAYLYGCSRLGRCGNRAFSSMQMTAASFGESRDSIQPRRAIMYVPGNDKRKIEKIKSVKVDCAVLDCEDGVAENKKSDARRTIKEIADKFDFDKTEFAVRINSIDSGHAEEDLKIILSGKNLPATLMVPKLENTNQLSWLNTYLKSIFQSRKLAKPLNLIIFIESARSLLNLKEICEKAIDLSNEGAFKFEGMVFGSDDFCADIGATRSDSAVEILTARQMFVLVAKAYKVQAIDMVYINYKDMEGLLKNSKEGSDMGFTGKQVIHPNQVPIVQKAFSPSREKIEWARELVKVFKEHQIEGKGAFTFRGAMIDKPLLLQAEYIIRIAEMLD